MVNIMGTLNIWPYIRYKRGDYVISRLSIGDAERRYQRFVDYALSRFSEPDLDVIFVVYSDLKSEYLKLIEKQIKKRYPFKNVIFQKTSAVLALNCGPGACGLMYMDKVGYSYNLGSMVVRDEEFVEEDVRSETDEEVLFEETKKEIVEEKMPPKEDHESNAIKEEKYEPQNPETESVEIDHKEETEVFFDPDRWYESIPGIDREKGIEQCGSEETYMEVLKMYYESLADEIEGLDGFFASQDWKNYIIKVHSLKSSSRLVGLESLADEAYKLERAGTEENTGYIMDYHKKTMEHFRSYIKPLGRVFE